MVFRPYLNYFKIYFIDDILAYPKTEEDNVSLKDCTLEVGERQSYVKFSKCEF